MEAQNSNTTSGPDAAKDTRPSVDPNRIIQELAKRLADAEVQIIMLRLALTEGTEGGSA